MTEELAFDQAGGQRRAVDADERTVATRAALVDGAREEFLAGAGFAEQKHGAIGIGDGFDPCECRPQQRTLADDLVDVARGRAAGDLAGTRCWHARERFVVFGRCDESSAEDRTSLTLMTRLPFREDRS